MVDLGGPSCKQDYPVRNPHSGFNCKFPLIDQRDTRNVAVCKGGAEAKWSKALIVCENEQKT